MAKNEVERIVEIRKPEKYAVLISFTDDADKKAVNSENVYWASKNQYPRDGYEPTADRLAYLQSNDTWFKESVIAGKAEK